MDESKLPVEMRAAMSDPPMVKGRCYVCGALKPIIGVMRHSVPSGVTNARGAYTTRYVRKCADCAPWATGQPLEAR